MDVMKNLKSTIKTPFYMHHLIKIPNKYDSRIEFFLFCSFFYLIKFDILSINNEPLYPLQKYYVTMINFNKSYTWKFYQKRI